jgi:hypothetical protein
MAKRQEMRKSAFGGRARGIKDIPEVRADIIGGRSALNGDDLFHDAATAASRFFDAISK